jgi:HEAT repeat protein
MASSFPTVREPQPFTVPTRAWQVATFVGLAAATYFAFRPAHPELEPSTSESAVEPGHHRVASGSRTIAIARPRAPANSNRVRELIERLESAHTAAAACTALDALGASGAPEVVGAVLEAVQTRRNEQARSCGISALARLATPEAIRALEMLANDPSTSMRQTTLASLAQSGEAEATRFVFGIARGADVERRHEALMALGIAHTREAAPLIIAAIEESSGNELRDLIGALGATGDSSAAPVLVGFTSDSSMEVRTAALTALGALHTPAAGLALRESLINGGREDAISAAEALSEIGDAASRAALFEAARTGRRSVASAAVRALANMEGDDVRDLMMAQLESPEAEAASVAFSYLANRHDEAALPQLIALARGGNSRLAPEAMNVIGIIGGESARAALEEISSQTGAMQSYALIQLARMPGTRGATTERALSILEHGGGQNRDTALDLLIGDRTDASRDALIAMVQSGHSGASGALNVLANRHDPESLRALTEFAQHGDDPQLRAQALQALGELHGTQSEATLLAATHDEDSTVRESAVQALITMGGEAADRTIAEASQSSDPGTRRVVLASLADQQSPASAEQIERFAHDDDPAIAHQAIEALVTASPERATAFLSTSIHASEARDRSWAVDVAERLDATASQPILAAAVRDHDPEVIASVARVLRARGGIESQELLVSMLTQDWATDDAHRAAAAAIDDLGGPTAEQYRALIDRYRDEAEAAGIPWPSPYG